MKTERISFPGATGAVLAARLDRPEGPVRAAAVLAHCFTCSKDIAAARRISGRLAALFRSEIATRISSMRGRRSR